MWLYKLLFFALLLKIAESNGIDQESEVEVSRFSNIIENWVKEGEESEELRQFIHSVALQTNLLRDWSLDQRSAEVCVSCLSLLNPFIKLRREGMSADDILDKVIQLCVKLNVETERVCRGVATLNLPIIVHIVDAKPNLTASTMCGVLLESQSCPLTDEEYNWTINIDSGPPTVVQPEESDENLNVVQIADIHYDPNYEPYGNTHCDEPTCCRKGQNTTNVGDKLAGYWGDYNYCDSPWHAVVDLLDHIKATHQNISYVYFTGDIVDHGVWETTREKNTRSIKRIYLQIYDTFRNVPLYPVLGNHETHPVNQYSPTSVTNDEINTKWLYNLIADLWINSGWLPESTRSTILQGGYYTVSPKKGFRIIALNSNVCFTARWWIWYQPKDPDGQLQWLSDTLLQAEKNGELVHILAHIPANPDCQSTWKREFLKIVGRYAHIIRAQFNGHTHNDELLLFYSSNDNTKVNNVAWNGGSLNANTNLNPNYKLYIVDSKNYAVKDYENWMYNLTLANERGTLRPLWYKSYSFKEEYDVSDLSHVSLNTWWSRLTTDDNLLNRYYRNFFKRADPSLRKECDAKCMKAYACRIITSLEPKHCD